MTILVTFRDLSANQEKHQLQYMTKLILLVVTDENFTRLQIVHSITDFFSAAGTTDAKINSQVIGFCEKFIWD